MLSRRRLRAMESAMTRRSSTTSSLIGASSHVGHKVGVKDLALRWFYIRCRTTPPDGRATRRRDMTRRHWRTGGVAVFVAVAAAGVAGCGGSSAPHVASLSNSAAKSPASTTTLPKGNPTQLLDEWASCMRAHGTPGLADPTIDANGVIHITMPASDSGPGPVSSRSNSGPGGGPCGAYLTAASTALRG